MMTNIRKITVPAPIQQAFDAVITIVLSLLDDSHLELFFGNSVHFVFVSALRNCFYDLVLLARFL